MRTLDESLADLRKTRGKDLDRGFYRGRAYQAKSRLRPGEKTTPADVEALEAAEKAALETANEATDRLKNDLAELYALLEEMGADLL